MKINRFLALAVVLSLAFAFVFSCSSDIDSPAAPGSSSSRQSNIIYGTPVNYGGETYQTVKIGNQTWMARNLNYAVEGSVCHSNESDNCARYGRLYNWATAMGISSSYNESYYNPSASMKYQGVCPQGWHIPSNDDWDELTNYVGAAQGCTDCAAKHLKAQDGWYDCGPSGSGNSYVCQDTYGFSALPGGYGSSDGSFLNVGDYGYWRSASEYDSDDAHSRGMHYIYERVHWIYGSKNHLVSIRCLQD